MAKFITFPITKGKLNRKNIVIAIGIVLILVITGGYIFLQKTGRLGEGGFREYVQKLGANLSTITQKSKEEENKEEKNIIESEVNKEELQITVPKQTGAVYEETAGQGEGITHLARRAVKKYLEKTGRGADLTPEHKIYIEDYIQNRTGDRWLDLGEKITFSEDLIKEAVESSRQLTSEQLENLKQFSAQVTSF